MKEQERSSRRSLQVYSMLSVHGLYSMLLMTYEKGFVFPGERHDFWELSLLLSGEAVITAEDSVYFSREGDLILHSPNSFHSFRAESAGGCKIFTISFDGSGLVSHLRSGQFHSTDMERSCVQRILDELTLAFGVCGEMDFTGFFHSAALDAVGLQVIKSQLELLCLSLVRRGEAARGLPARDIRSQTYAQIVTFLRDNVEQNLTLQEISGAVFESPGKIKALFRDFTGGGVMQYFNQLRREHIMALLAEGNSVKTIADRMNFSSPYYLSFFFKRETGMTPREYLKRLSEASVSADKGSNKATP